MIALHVVTGWMQPSNLAYIHYISHSCVELQSFQPMCLTLGITQSGDNSIKRTRHAGKSYTVLHYQF